MNSVYVHTYMVITTHLLCTSKETEGAVYRGFKAVSITVRLQLS